MSEATTSPPPPPGCQEKDLKITGVGSDPLTPAEINVLEVPATTCYVEHNPEVSIADTTQRYKVSFLVCVPALVVLLS